MSYMLITSVSLLLAAAVNSCSVYLQSHHRIYERFRHGLLLHTLIILPFWLLFGLLLSMLDKHYRLQTISLPILGYLLAVLAVSIFVAAVYVLGPGSLININLFNARRATRKGIYKYFKDPIYDSYWLLFLALGFVTSNAAFFIISGLSFISLNIIESAIERI
jgi:protein-S-isoprenylcysteine O-methyltransferase Ste14